jgi:amino acid adenylation domain-containing protein
MDGQNSSSGIHTGPKEFAAPTQLQQFSAPPNGIPLGCKTITPRMLTLVELELEEIERIALAVPGGSENIQDIYPLAPLQEGMLFHHMLRERGDTYVISGLFEFQSRTRLDAFVEAFQHVIHRHDILRTAVFSERLSRPLQVVFRHAILPVEEVELDRDRDPVEEFEERMRPGRQRLDLRQAPLMRLQVARHPCGTCWYALLRIHHIVCDGKSYETLIAEVMARLSERGRGPVDPTPYRDYVARALVLAWTHDTEAFFRRKLADIDEPTAPFGLLDVHGDVDRIDEASQILDRALVQRVRTQARRQRASVAALFHAAWGLTVARTSARHDVVFGTVILGHSQMGSGTRQNIGLFINTLPLRLRLWNITVGDLVARAHRELLELLIYQQSPLTLAQRCSGISGSVPLFTTLLDYRDRTPSPEADRGRAASGIRALGSRSWSNYPISLSVDDFGEEFLLTTQTDPRLDARRITECMHMAVQSLVEALENVPHTPALALSILPDRERHQVIEEFNTTAVDYPREALIHRLFEEQVERTPEATAVAYDGRSLTYQELNEKANQLARRLRENQVGPGQRVGLWVERSLEMVVGLLGVLKAGGAYVPLDPNYPTERLAYMLKDSAPQVLLTQERLKHVVPPSPARVIALDSDWGEIGVRTETGVEVTSPHLTPSDLAYMIYTSGSTGEPKGVMVSHGNLLASTVARHRFYGKPGRFLLLSSFGFDSSVAGIFGTLTGGGTLLIATQEAVHDPAVLAQALCQFEATSLLCVPSLYQSLLKLPGVAIGSSTLSNVIVAGEACPPTLISESARRAPGITVFNEYGPTEATVWATVFECDAQVEMTAVPIGRPVANTRIYIVDDYGQPVPMGVAGEIYIGGAGVAQGYFNRPELTSTRFVPDPFSHESGARLYRSGDTGRWREDGNIEYLGRNDQQVKIRGFRIELGEIEARLLRHAQVKEAAVTLREDLPGEGRLVAYVVTRKEVLLDSGEVASGVEGASVSVEELRTHLRSTLPQYMIPSAVVVLESLPLSANGKLDRRALPAPGLEAYVSGRYEPPQGDVEEILVGIWQELLRVERIGRYDNFFELGGHSLLIVQMMERLRRVGLSAEIHRVFQSPTLVDLAGVLTSDVLGQLVVPPNLIPAECETITPEMLPLVALDTQQIARVVQNVPGGARNIQDLYPLAPLQEGILFHHLLDQQHGDTYILRIALSVASRERLDALIAAFQAVMNRHDILRTAVLWEQLPRAVQIVYRQATLPVEEIALDRDRDPSDQVLEWIRPERQRLDLRLAPPIRLRIAADPRSSQWYVLLQLHSIVCDHLTLEIITFEVIAYLEGRAQQLPESVPYRNHVAQALAHARTHDTEAFFRSKLAEINETTAPFGLLNVHGDGSQIEEAHLVLPDELARRIRFRARRLTVSAATLFHAAWSMVIAHTSGHDDVVFGTVLLGRLQGSAGAQRVLGMFINTLPLRLQLQGVTAKDLVEQAQRELVELLSHEQASLAVARRCSGVVGSTPLFSALLNYRHSVPNPEADWNGADGIQVVAAQERTNYPIMLSIDDLGDGFTLTAQTDRRVDPHRLTGYMHTALQSLVDALEHSPTTPALSLSMLPTNERQQVLDTFNATPGTHGQEKLIHELFEEEVRRTPNAIAVVYQQKSLTYAELNSRANQLARYLLNRGVGPDRLVGICLERGLEMVVGLLGILKAGGAYIPLDPSYPAERLRYMLKDSAPQVLLTQESLRAALPAVQMEMISLDTKCTEIADHATQNLPVVELGLNAGNLVYVIYTSGSTGQPKGTAMTHRSMVNLIEWHRSTFGAGNGRRALQFAALSFDVAFQETFSTLCTGATLVLLEEEVRRDARALTELLRSQSVERLFVPPLMLQNLAECCQAMNVAPQGLKDVITAGEQLYVSPEISRLFKQLDGCRLHNHYGPTETHVVTALTLTGDAAQWPTLPAIGRPISNARIYVLDIQRQPVPVGVVGEIYIGGAGIARGYLSRPEVTGERFLPDPFSADLQARMYRTGDLGRWQPDGIIEYLGRNDHQVKIRGFRIEPGEIEAQLLRHPEVKEAVIIMREDVPGEKRLVAYLTRRAAGDPSVETLRTYLRATLPEHMVPTAFVMLESLPLTPNGKLDRHALPIPELRAYARQEYDAPQGAIEETLAAVWSEVLRVQQVGRHDNFFALGGHSLLGMKLITKIAEILGIQPPMVTIFRYPTVREMAQLVEQLLSDDRRPSRAHAMELEEGLI